MTAKTPRKPYRTDLSDGEWTLLEPLLPALVPAGAPRTTDLREVVNAILYRLHQGCAWHALPHDFPPEGDQGALEKFSVEERGEWLALWKEVGILLERATGS